MSNNSYRGAKRRQFSDVGRFVGLGRQTRSQHSGRNRAAQSSENQAAVTASALAYFECDAQGSGL